MRKGSPVMLSEAKHLQCVLEDMQMQIRRFAQDDLQMQFPQSVGTSCRDKREQGHLRRLSAHSRRRGLHRNSALAVLALLLVPSPMAAARSVQSRVRIPKSAEVEGETIRLSDLLPPDAPSELGETAARIVLGDSPFPASQRILSRGEIELELREFPSVREQLELPEHLVVFCRQRRLSSDEIWTAIETFLAAEGLSATGAALQRLPSYQATVFVTRQDPGLVVKRMEPDRVRRQVRFLLWTSKEPQVLPFYVSVDEHTGSSDRLSPSPGSAGSLAGNPDGHHETEGQNFAGWLTDNLSGVPAHKLSSAPSKAPPAIILVTKGHPAKLVVETPTLRMTALVTPLESGAKGQVIRVKNVDTQRVFKAEVIGEGVLAGELAGK